MCEECAPSVPVSRLIGRSSFGDSFGRVNDAASKNIQEVISLRRGLMWNDAAVCGGRMDLNIFVGDLSERWMSLESEPVIMFSVTLICWEYRDTSLLTRVHPNHRAIVSWGFSLTGLNEYLLIHPRSFELSVKARMWDPCPSCWMVM